MSLSDCQHCWDTPCTCGWEYKDYTPDQLAEIIIGLTQRRDEDERLMILKKAVTLFEEGISQEIEDPGWLLEIETNFIWKPKGEQHYQSPATTPLKHRIDVEDGLREGKFRPYKPGEAKMINMNNSQRA